MDARWLPLARDNQAALGAAALEPRLDEGAEASYGFSYDQRVRFARAFIGIDSFGVGNEATDVVLEQDAVAAEQFARIADSLAAFDCQPTSAGQFI